MTKIMARAWPSSCVFLLLVVGLVVLARPAGAQGVPEADLSILKFDLPSDAVAVGQPLNYELAVANNGPGDASGVRVTDTLPSNTRFLAFTPGNPGTCTNSGNTVTCNLDGLAVNEEVSIFFDVCPVAPGTATNRASVNGLTPDPVASNNSSTETTQVTPGSGECAAAPPRPPNPQPGPRPNAAPDARNDSYATGEDRTLTVRRPGVLGNDRDANGDRLASRVAKGPRHGNLTLRADGSFVYRPDRNYNGRDTFVYSVSDGRGGTDRATVTLRVRPAPEPGGSSGNRTSGINNQSTNGSSRTSTTR